MLLFADVVHDSQFTYYYSVFVPICPVWISLQPPEWFYLLLLDDADYYPHGFF